MDVEANTQMSKGVTERRIIEACRFFFSEKSLGKLLLKGLVTVMISRFPEFLLDWSTFFLIWTENTLVFKCRQKHQP